MVTLSELWLPIMLSGAAVWIISALAWMVMPHHKNEYKPIANEDAFLAVIKSSAIPPGQYMFPHCGHDPSKYKNDPALKAKVENGPWGLAQRGRQELHEHGPEDARFADLLSVRQRGDRVSGLNHALAPVCVRLHLPRHRHRRHHGVLLREHSARDLVQCSAASGCRCSPRWNSLWFSDWRDLRVAVAAWSVRYVVRSAAKSANPISHQAQQ